MHFLFVGSCDYQAFPNEGVPLLISAVPTVQCPELHGIVKKLDVSGADNSFQPPTAGTGSHITPDSLIHSE